MFFFLLLFFSENTVTDYDPFCFAEYLTLLYFICLQLSNELGFPVVPKANLTFSKCLEMKLNDHIQTIAKVAEVAGKEYSIEQVGACI